MFRCVKLPDDNQQEDYDYYAIDVTNSPELMALISEISFLAAEENIYSVSSCVSLVNASVSTAKYPPCDPTTFKIRPICETQCATFFFITSECFGEAIESGLSIFEFASTYDMYNCSNPATHLPNVSIDVFDSQQNCFNVSAYDRLGKLVAVGNSNIVICFISAQKISGKILCVELFCMICKIYCFIREFRSFSKFSYKKFLHTKFILQHKLW